MLLSAAFLIFVELQDQFVEACYGGLDIIVLDIYRYGEQLVLDIRLGELQQVLGMRDFRLKALQFL